MFAKLFTRRPKSLKRKMTRFEVGSECAIETDIGTFSGILEDISPIGALLRSDAPVGVGETVRISHAAAGDLSGMIVRQKDGRLAIEFPLDGDSANYVLKAITVPMTKPEGEPS